MTRFPKGRKPLQPGEKRKQELHSTEFWIAQYARNAKEVQHLRMGSPTERKQNKIKVRAIIEQARMLLKTVNDDRKKKGLKPITVREIKEAQKDEK